MDPRPVPGHDARHVHGVEPWDGHGTGDEGFDRDQPSSLWLPSAAKRHAREAAEGDRLVVAGPGAGLWKPRSIPGRSGLYLYSSDLVKRVVAFEVDLLVKPDEALAHHGVGIVWGLDGRGLDALEEGQPSLADAVAGITPTIRESLAEVIGGAGKLAGMPDLGALVLGEVGGALVAMMVAPLVAHLQLGAEVIKVASMVLPAGDVRAWALTDHAKGWAEQAVAHGLDDYLGPWSRFVSLAAGIDLACVAFTSRESRLEARAHVDIGRDVEAWDRSSHGFERWSTAEVRAHGIEDELDAPGKEGWTLEEADPPFGPGVRELDERHLEDERHLQYLSELELGLERER